MKIAGDPTTRFSDRVDNYIRYRPGYPPEILPWLKREFSLNSSVPIADIGSGTGILTRIFLQNGNPVFGVEPNDAMRHAADEALKDYAHFTSIKGTAEQTGLADDSMDFITAAQAFHWFDAAKAKTEFQRIAKQNGYVVLIWNERQVSSPFEKEYESLLHRYATDYSQVDHRNINGEKIAAFYRPHPYVSQVFHYQQLFDFTGLKGRLLSSSYVPNQDNPSHEAMIADLQGLYKNFAVEDKIKLDYETKVYVGKIK